MSEKKWSTPFGAQSRCTSTTTWPLEVSSTALKTSGVFSGALGTALGASALLASLGDEHPTNARAISTQIVRIVPQYGMLNFGALRRFRVVLQSLLERGVS